MASQWGPLPKSWPLVRERVLGRDEYECQFCGVSNEAHCEEYGRGLEVHHILPKRVGGRDHPHNLITVCKHCHGVLRETHARAMVEVKREQDGEPMRYRISIQGLKGSVASVIPAPLAQKYNIEPGDEVFWEDRDGELIVHPPESRGTGGE